MDLLSGLLIGTLVGSSLAMSTPTKDEASATTTAAAVTVQSLESAVVAADGKREDSRNAQEVQLLSLEEAVKASSKTTATESSASKTDVDASTKKVLKPVKRRVLVFKATWCSACQGLESEWPRLREVKWRVGTKETDHFQLVDSDIRPDLVARYGITQLPTLLLLDGDKVIERTGSLGAVGMAELYYKGLKALPASRNEQASTSFLSDAVKQ